MSPSSTSSAAVDRRGSATVTTPSDREIRITRIFDAPAQVVFDVWTTPAYVRRWWSGDRAPLVVCEIDLRVGGAWRYVTRDAQGVELAWSGVYQEIEAPHRLVATEMFEAHPDAVAQNTWTLEERDGTTMLTVDVLHASQDNRDGHLNSGMEPGMQLALDRFETLLDETVLDEEARS